MRIYSFSPDQVNHCRNFHPKGNFVLFFDSALEGRGLAVYSQLCFSTGLQEVLSKPWLGE
jgi:hypothetical protein